MTKTEAEKALRDYIEGQVDATLLEYACNEQDIKNISAQGDELLRALDTLVDKTEVKPI